MNDVTKIDNLPAARADITPMEILQQAVAQGADIDKLERLMALEERWRANRARDLYVQAMNRFKAEPTKILKRKTANVRSDKGSYSYNYAPLVDVVAAAVGNLSKHGLSHRWEVSQEKNEITVTCVVTHEAGHSERVALSAPPDTSGGKNVIQQIASTVSYLERYTLLAATGLAAADMDDDAKASGKPPEPEIPEDDPIRKLLMEQASFRALQEVWDKKLTAQQRKAYRRVKDEAKTAIEAAEKKA